MEYFYLEQSFSEPNKYLINFNHNLLKLKNTKGSFNIILARLMNLSYAQFLRMCRDVYGAELIGKNNIYVLPYFDKNSNGAANLIKELNKRINILKEKKCL